jgi:tRNA A-37 threonylcarbamoyl transferase component Bud32
MASRHFNCPSCSKEISIDSQTCPNCGALIDDGATRRFDARKTPIQSYDSIDNARFVPGTILIQRYRIVGLLGKGGMGEVYRADDLKLGQPVALKFLPDQLLRDGAALARFHREVRVARQVSHKNVCRVYDIGETDGRHFLSMEYIKGEELSSLLRRIGSLPVDKSIQLARQICAGLNAAHDVGVLHRDLKPANIMIDGDGNARILDFGLASLSEELPESELAAGTPAYMAPEQLEGKEQTAKTDIYSLGLVLYELFTSKKAFEAKTLAELMEMRRNNTAPTSLSSLVKDLDPLIERVVERCLQTDPALRPSSALQVAAALPGGDPIAAALAAGETPSPEMVAAAPKHGILSPVVAGSLLAGFLLLLALGSWLTKYTAIYRLASLGDSPEVLRARARDVVKNLGYSEAPVDYADGFVLKYDYLDYIATNDSSPERWEKMRNIAPGPYRYWYRQSPRYFETSETIAVDKPALDISGMTSLYLGVNGQLHWFLAVPPQREPQTSEQVKVDWSIPFRAAGLDIKNFQPVTSTWIPLHAYDERAAWDGVDATNPNEKVHVEAAAYHGRLVYFDTIYPWDRSARQVEVTVRTRNKIFTFMLIVICLLALFGSALLARRNLRLGRGDRRGATRVAIVFFVVRMFVWAFAVHHNGLAGREFDLFLIHLAFAVFLAAFLWLLYVALEPFVRKKWPGWIISWSRLLAGDYRDPLVGRDLLIGTVVGASLIVIALVGRIAPNWIGQATPATITPATEILNPGLFFGRFAAQLSAGLFLAFIFVFLLLVFVAVLRSEMLSLIALGILMTIMGMLISDSSLIMLPFSALSSFLVLFVLRRYGLLALVAALFVAHLYVFFPITTDLTAWYAREFTIALVICVALGVYAAYTSVGGAKVFAERV